MKKSFFFSSDFSERKKSSIFPIAMQHFWRSKTSLKHITIVANHWPCPVHKKEDNHRETTSFVVAHDDKILDSWGKISKRLGVLLIWQWS